MRILKHIINWIVWTFLGLYAVVMIAVHTPFVQRELGDSVAQVLADKLGTKVHIGRVDLGFLNRIILDSVVVYDQQHRQMLCVGRMTAKVDVTPLTIGRISISSAQLFGANVYLSKPSATLPANYQFVLDSLASKDTTSHTPLDLRINSFIIRNSAVSYDQWDVPQTPGKLNPQHIALKGISAHILLKALKDDSLNVNVKRLTFLEHSGLNVRRLSFLLTAGNSSINLHDFQLQLPQSNLHIDSVMATFDRERFKETLNFKGHIGNTSIRPSDFSFLLPQLQGYHHLLALNTDFNYQDRTLQVPRIEVESSNGDINLLARGLLTHPSYGKDSWKLHFDRLSVQGETLDYVSRNIQPLPDPVLRLGDIQLKGDVESDAEGTIRALADLSTTLGHVDAQGLLKADGQFSGTVKTDGVDIGRLIDNNKVGMLATNMEVNGVLDKQLAAKGRIERLDYDGDTYTNIELNGRYATNQIAGMLTVDNPKVTAQLMLDLKASNLNDAVGVVSINNLTIPEKDYHLDYLRVESGFDEGRHFVTLNSDFAHADLSGEFDYATLAQSVANAIGYRLPTLPGLPALTKETKNNFALQMTLGKTDWLQKMLGVNVDIDQPVTLKATVNDRARQLMVDLTAPAFNYDGDRYKDASLYITSPNDTLFLKAALGKCRDEGEQPLALNVDGHAEDNNLTLSLNWDNHDNTMPVHGLFNLSTQFYRNFDDQPEAHVHVLPSDLVIANSRWQIEPSDILYSTKHLLIDHFFVHNGEQNIWVNGVASEQASDSVVVDLNNVEVAYILDLVDFDAVSFSGLASGKAYLHSAFNDPDAYANLTVNNFKFENGRMGVLQARVDWNKDDKQIDIHATANDGAEAITYINGYVSPEREYIDLGLSARGTYLDFMHNYTESFISHITGHGRGDLRLAGPLSAINLTGGLRIDGEATITPLNTTYQLRNDTITFVYNEILLDSLPIYDRDNNIAYLSGAVHHDDLTNLSLDLRVDTDQLLGYDFHDFGDQSFYGTVYAAGQVDIHMKGNDVNIDCNVTPLKNSVFVYNASQADAISDQGFITWKAPAADTTATVPAPQTSTTNIYMNFLVNVTPDGTMRILMDAKTGDYITFNGNGSLRASYYNKGTFEMFGTYTVESGTYDITIQNIINKKFQFQPGGTLIFGGDPYSAALNLQALYTVNGVSLSDLSIGNSFSSNTVRVNCLMNIGGQPSAPQVTFDLDLPNVNSDEKQMVRSLLSSQQEMNQQVLYLLGIGRFYSLGQNNANQQEQQDQTSLAMNSFLSGTLSTQINNVINQIVKNDDWNFGANISTGTQGWNNAEYEGIVNGRMLNNRLLINGQFGYRDNATKATPSFVGDFDVRYLLLPNGNLALKVYNQTNDRYFTRSSLNTQGLGIILKKDFNGLSDLLHPSRSKQP